MAAKKSQPLVFRAEDLAVEEVTDTPPPAADALTPLDQLRSQAIDHAGQTLLLAYRITDIRRARQIAASIRRPSPAKLRPDAGGRYGARVFNQPDGRTYGIAVWYNPNATRPEQ